ncbi:MAG: glycosyltransferase, partial [Porphyromonas sp.]
MRYSFIIPVYNRPDEIRELLESMTQQGTFDYEVIIVEDGSQISSEPIVEAFRSQLPALRYIAVPNGGPSKARNRGAREASGEYLLILDSDVVLPPGYLTAVDEYLERYPVDAFGGPDAASDDFTPVQKAINYAMTSPLTTGGIRGGSADGMEKFKPRSFNLGCRRSVYLQLGGFDEAMRFGEDIDFSLRLLERGYSTALISEAFVYHKRRVDFKKFFKQVHNSGIARIHLETRHPGSTKLVHLLPALFTIASVIALFLQIGRVGLLLLAVVFSVEAYHIAGRSLP